MLWITTISSNGTPACAAAAMTAEVLQHIDRAIPPQPVWHARSAVFSRTVNLTFARCEEKGSVRSMAACTSASRWRNRFIWSGR